ncbi:hypothetical protein FOXG_16328 [Fusarium oxysporum f. sp. lycopersici 4287]|nr:hypothetical protein FOXG_06742 [Fusarium oxysporum f. sp. lycopersici 4287]XP_018244673.1 hypothetical protein FOXG_07302 [Fusarium oxysporum f. sp. lycopersici 4287]XP_018256970.1 uncharacterized protein FOXG_16328 [Fusarium oxysporum f. sp. lycopersici 4287]KNB04701.1 hypothetical protein FOXG_06742 [Fusarium oxysporum f. sp. lycopersici 4287]KNB06628.1 hypothetical protein FOXG_07302 [Fusarium oxysporum f. sp. lycopersici 4287]KNB18925.1 hypothetical protein FOXG_16328 [Fusarium oxyspor
MATKNTYILVSDLTTPPPPYGPVDLGHILDNPTTLNPLNAGPTQRLKISSDEIYGPHKMEGFTATRKELFSGKFGIWAKFLSTVLGVGANAGVNTELDDDTVYSFGSLETMFFNPTDDYIRSSMTVPVIRSFMRSARFALPVYMITGIKVGREVSVQSSHQERRGFDMSTGAGHPGNPASGGLEMGTHSTKAQGFSFERGDDCVVALRLRKITYKSGEVKHKVEVKGATMQDGSQVLKEDETPELDLSDDIRCEVALDDFDDEMVVVDGTSFEDEAESRWIILA